MKKIIEKQENELKDYKAKWGKAQTDLKMAVKYIDGKEGETG